jgi:hypothetical protein
VAAAPETLTLKVNRDLEGRRWQPWLRRALLGLLALLLLAALLNAFGQRPHLSTGSSDAATLTVFAPRHARSGLVYAPRFTIKARRELKDAQLVLDQGWASGYTVNGVAPQPVTEASRNGKLVFGFGHVPAGHKLVFYLSLQVNPTIFGRRSQNVELDDDGTRLLTVHRHVTIFP